MKQYEMGFYDVIVIGAGHAGCEAGLAAARLGMKTAVFTIQLDAVALLACNPSIGGTGKGQLVREIDALGGEMGLAIDDTLIHCKMLNSGKGPAVHSLRAQADKQKYQIRMKQALEKQNNLELKQGEVIDLLLNHGLVNGVLLQTGALYRSKAVILATGTFLGGKVFIGEHAYESGPCGLAPSSLLSSALRKHGVALRRFKTGTPTRVLGRSLDFSLMKEQKGDVDISPFSFMNIGKRIRENTKNCWLTYTNEGTHNIIQKNLNRSALFSGLIQGIGPRYCPSIEDKVNRFSEKERHQVFLEPEGLDTDEYYVQGMSTSMPEDVQAAFYRTVPGLANAVFCRPGYAIEYDCINPITLYPTLEHKTISGLYCAGQFNGTSGYEEAAAQGLIAGTNAALKIKNKPAFVLDRSQAYIGVLIDDLVTKGPEEPYRMMTSRAEYRLVIRQDNADLRLTELGSTAGLINRERLEIYCNSKNELESEIRRLRETLIDVDTANELLIKHGSATVVTKISLTELLKRPEISYETIKEIGAENRNISSFNAMRVEIHIKYDGYIQKQIAMIERFKKNENRLLPEELDYQRLDGLRIEARQKLDQVRPLSLGQASRIAGVTSADINVLMIHLAKLNKTNKKR